MWQRLARLPRRQRAVLVLRYYEQRADPEIADLLSCAQATVRAAQQLVGFGHRIAQNIRFPGTSTVTPSFGLRDLPGGTAGHPVQGHATRHLDEKGYRTLWVLDAVDVAPVTIAGRVPLDDLYDIADHLVLPH